MVDDYGQDEQNERERVESANTDTQNYVREHAEYDETENLSVLDHLKKKLKRSRSTVKETKAKIRHLESEIENLKTFNLKLQQQLLTNNCRNNVVSIHV